MTYVPTEKGNLADNQRKPGQRSRTPLLFPRLASVYARLGPTAYVLLRIDFGLTMFTHGIPKLLHEAHGSMANPAAAATNLIAHGLGLPFAPQLASFVAYLEVFGGLAIALGMLTRLVAPMFAVEMAVIALVLGPKWPWTDRGIEYPVILGFVALFLSFQGGGPASIDSAIAIEL